MTKEKLVEVHGVKVTPEQEKIIHDFIYKIFNLSEWETLSLEKKKSLIKAVLGMETEESTIKIQKNPQDETKINEIKSKIELLEKEIREETSKQTEEYVEKEDDKEVVEEPMPKTAQEEKDLHIADYELEKKFEKALENVKPKEIKETYNPQSSKLDKAKLDHYAERLDLLKKEIGKMFIGQTDTVHMIILALLCEAHVLLEGVPGLAKSVLIETLSRTIKGVSYKRIQFIPDMLPSDLIGGQIFNPKTNEFVTVKGPIFANLVLADEVNRAPPKVHAALMEAMAERKVTIDKEEFRMAKPFLVMATQNPLEQKGTYALPEAVMDRFMFKVDLTYPDRKDELIIITENNTTRGEKIDSLKKVISKDDVVEMQNMVKEVFISDRIKNYILDIIEASRGLNKNVQGIKYVQNGGSPRATIALGIGSRANALAQGRNYVLPEDVIKVAKSILRHRLGLNFKGKAYNVSTDKIVDEILNKVSGV